MTVETFRPEITEAVKAFDKYVVSLDKLPEEFELSLASLITKAIKAYESRGPELRHGIAYPSYPYDNAHGWNAHWRV